MSHPTQDPPPTRRLGFRTMELLIPLAVFVAWIVLQIWVLPRFGVKT